MYKHSDWVMRDPSSVNVLVQSSGVVTRKIIWVTSSCQTVGGRTSSRIERK